MSQWHQTTYDTIPWLISLSVSRTPGNTMYFTIWLCCLSQWHQKYIDWLSCLSSWRQTTYSRATFLKTTEREGITTVVHFNKTPLYRIKKKQKHYCINAVYSLEFKFMQTNGVKIHWTHKMTGFHTLVLCAFATKCVYTFNIL